MYQKRRNMENMLIWLIDIFCILCGSALAFWIRYGILSGSFEHGGQAWAGIYHVPAVHIDQCM